MAGAQERAAGCRLVDSRRTGSAGAGCRDRRQVAAPEARGCRKWGRTAGRPFSVQKFENSVAAKNNFSKIFPLPRFPVSSTGCQLMKIAKKRGRPGADACNRLQTALGHLHEPAGAPLQASTAAARAPARNLGVRLLKSIGPLFVAFPLIHWGRSAVAAPAFAARARAGACKPAAGGPVSAHRARSAATNTALPRFRPVRGLDFQTAAVGPGGPAIDFFFHWEKLQTLCAFRPTTAQFPRAAWRVRPRSSAHLAGSTGLATPGGET